MCSEIHDCVIHIFFNRHYVFVDEQDMNYNDDDDVDHNDTRGNVL